MNNLKKSKTQKGITLIALIITIIVLLILALVTIRAVQGDGIINYAQKAKNDYERESEAENTTLGGYLSIIESNIPGGNNVVSGGAEEMIVTWIDNGDGTFTSSNGVTVEIGDYVDYNEGNYTHTPDTEKGTGTSKTGGDYSTGYTLGTGELTTENLSWRILGVNEQGQLELISADPTIQTLYLANDEGYINAEDNLNNFCNDLYGKGSYASGARSLNAEDINKLTNYDPTTYSGYSYKYGDKVIYRYPTEEEKGSSTTYMQYSKDDGKTWNNTNLNFQTFRLPGDATALSSSNPGRKEVIFTVYSYNITDNLTTDDGYTSEKAIEISNIISQGTTEVNLSQWLASRAVERDGSDRVFCGALVVYNGEIKFNYMFDSTDSNSCAHNSVRPVVTLSTNVTVTTNSEANSSTNMWILS